MTSTDTLLQSHRVCTRRRSLTGWFFVYPPLRTSLSLSDLHTHAKVLYNVTPIDLLIQSAILLVQNGTSGRTIETPVDFDTCNIPNGHRI